MSQQQLKKKNVEPYCAFCQSTAANSIKVIMNFAFDLMCKDYTYPSASILTQRQRTSRISNQLLLTNTEKKTYLQRYKLGNTEKSTKNLKIQNDF